MAEYIERKKAVNAVRNVWLGVQAINRIKAADVEPVRHGRWIIGDGDDDFDVKCSVCGWTDIFDVCGIGMVKPIASKMHYCQNCGARMDLGGDDNGCCE